MEFATSHLHYCPNVGSNSSSHAARRRRPPPTAPSPPPPSRCVPPPPPPWHCSSSPRATPAGHSAAVRAVGGGGEGRLRPYGASAPTVGLPLRSARQPPLPHRDGAGGEGAVGQEGGIAPLCTRGQSHERPRSGVRAAVAQPWGISEASIGQLWGSAHPCCSPWGSRASPRHSPAGLQQPQLCTGGVGAFPSIPSGSQGRLHNPRKAPRSFHCFFCLLPPPPFFFSFPPLPLFTLCYLFRAPRCPHVGAVGGGGSWRCP